MHAIAGGCIHIRNSRRTDSLGIQRIRAVLRASTGELPHAVLRFEKVPTPGRAAGQVNWRIEHARFTRIPLESQGMNASPKLCWTPCARRQSGTWTWHDYCNSRWRFGRGIGLSSVLEGYSVKLAATFLIALAQVGQVDPLTHQLTIAEGLDNPARIAVAGGEILVADTRANTIVRFDLSGNLLGTWSESAGPVGIAVAPDGRIYVSRRDDAKVAVYSPTFVFQEFVADGVVSFVRPTDLAIDAISGRLYIVDSGADSIHAFESDGSHAWTVGTRGGSSGQFKNPSAIAVDNAFGHVVVADQDNFRVQIYTNAGIFVSGFGYRTMYLPGGESEGWLPRIAGLAVDVSGNIFVTDAVMGTLQIFDSYGGFLGKVVDYGSGAGELNTPGDVEIDGSGRIVVANSRHGTVEIYDSPAGFVASAHAVVVTGTNESTLDEPRRKSKGGTKPSRGRLSSRTGAMGGPVTATTPGWDPPHTLDDVTCGRCHDIDGQPGGHIATVQGQANVCISCHTGAGSACTSALRTVDCVFSDEALPDSEGRSHAWGVPADNDAVGSVGPPPGGEMDRYLAPGDIIKCATCHNQHSHVAGSPYLRVGNSNGALCKECHADHIGHTPSGSWQPTCDECHDMHNPNSRNLALIGTTVNGRSVLFTSTTGPNSLEDGDPTENDGLCQVCHTATTYHTKDGTGAPHNDGDDCTSCHPHEAGFMPTGGDCTSCHATVQDLAGVGPDGGRRAVVGEFPTDDAHAHYGAELGEAACVVCHDQATHMDGNVDLIDPDSGALYTFVRPFEMTLSESDPDLTDFCMTCHDADGAARLGADALDPFGDGSAPADVASKFQGTLQWDEWYGDGCFGNEGTLRQVNSHHDVSDADQAWSGARIECLNCHGAHAVGESQPLVDPFNLAAPWAGSDNEFCISCHWGGYGPDDPGLPASVDGPTVPLRALDSCDYRMSPWYVSYNWTHAAHGLDSKRGWTSYSGAPGAVDALGEVGTEVECMSCHDPHGSYTATNTAGNPYAIRDSVDGTRYVDDGVRPGPAWTGPPWDDVDSQGTLQESVVVSISGTQVSWGNLCSACHADWLAAYDWHSYCDGCQTCHGHGQDWQNYDWGSGNDEHTDCPFNNNCDSATAVTLDAVTFDAIATGDTVSADDDAVEVCGTSLLTDTLWFSVVGTGGTLSATTCMVDTTFDTNIQVFCDGCVDPVCVTANDDDASCGSSEVSSTVIWCSDPNQTYLIQVGGSNGESGAFTLYVADDQTGCGEPDGCAAVPAPLVGGAAPAASGALDDETRTAPHPDDGSPVPLHGIPRGR